MGAYNWWHLTLEGGTIWLRNLMMVRLKTGWKMTQDSMSHIDPKNATQWKHRCKGNPELRTRWESLLELVFGVGWVQLLADSTEEQWKAKCSGFISTVCESFGFPGWECKTDNLDHDNDNHTVSTFERRVNLLSAAPHPNSDTVISGNHLRN